MSQENNEYIQINKTSWNQRVPIHVASDFYDVEGFKNGNTSLKEIELQLLGNISGKKLLHLQCHFGQDTLSLARMGAQVTGVDFSEDAIQKANELTAALGLEANFICSSVYDLPDVLNETFDIVYTSYGVIGWLPDMTAWAKVIQRFLKPGGKLVLVEFHPAMWMFDDDFNHVAYSYFCDTPIIETTSGTYANKDANLSIKSITWNHSLSEVIGNLLKEKLTIKTFEEYNYSPYNCVQGMIATGESSYIIEKMGNKLPLTYAVVAEK